MGKSSHRKSDANAAGKQDKDLCEPMCLHDCFHFYAVSSQRFDQNIKASFNHAPFSVVSDLIAIIHVNILLASASFFKHMPNARKPGKRNEVSQSGGKIYPRGRGERWFAPPSWISYEGANQCSPLRPASAPDMIS